MSLDSDFKMLCHQTLSDQKVLKLKNFPKLMTTLLRHKEIIFFKKVTSLNYYDQKNELLIVYARIFHSTFYDCLH